MRSILLSFMKRGATQAVWGSSVRLSGVPQCKNPSSFYIVAPSSICGFLFMVQDDCLNSILCIHIPDNRWRIGGREEEEDAPPFKSTFCQNLATGERMMP